MPRAQILVKTKMFDRDYKPGAILTAAQVAKIPAKNRHVLISQGTIELIGGSKSKKTEVPAGIKKAGKVVAETQAAVKAAEDDVATVRSKIESAESRVKELVEGRRPFALQAAKGDTDAQNKLAELHKIQYRAELETDDFRTALTEALAVLETAQAGLVQADHGASVAEARGVMAERIKAAQSIDELVNQLELAVSAYKAAGRRFGVSIGADMGAPVYLSWPLESRVAVATGAWVEPVKSESKASLAAFEKRTLDPCVERFERNGPSLTNGADRASVES